jgi:hypothetical protein
MKPKKSPKELLKKSPKKSSWQLGRMAGISPEAPRRGE